jgi:ATP-dependent RNA helicase RhlE
MDHLDRRTLSLQDVRTVVLDEADQMLDMGFIVPIRQIVKHLPKKRQNLFFSATMPADIGKLAGELLNDPVKVSVAPPSTTVERVNQQVAFIEAGRKRGLLIQLFSKPEFTRVLVFTRTKRGADKVARILEGGGVQAMAIHGNKSQAQRERALAEFKAGKVRALVATDIAARGIDISSVSHVVQYELPDVPEQYVHRIGRTARAGADGSAVAFCAEDERGLLKDIERTTRQKIPSVDRRNDTELAQLSANIKEDTKRGGRAESRGAPQPRRQQQPRRDDHRSAPRRDGRAGDRAEHLQHEPRVEAEGRNGRRRRGNGGSAGGDGGGGRSGEGRNGQSRVGDSKSPHAANGQKPRGQKPTNHRKGQGPARGDVMKVNADGSAGPVMSANALMRHIGSTNPWSQK